MREVVRFLALRDIVLDQPLDLGAFPGSIQWWAGGTIRTPGTEPISLRAAAENLTLAAFGSAFAIDQPLPTALTDIALTTPLILTGFTAENTQGSLFLIGGDIHLQGVRLGAPAAIGIVSTHDLTITGVTSGPVPPPLVSQPNPQSPEPSLIVSDTIANLSAVRDLTLDGVGVRAPVVRLKAGRNLTLTRVQLNDTSTPPSSFNTLDTSSTVSGKQVRLTTENLAALRLVTFASNDVLLSARTVALQNVIFRQGSRVILESERGTLAPNPNTGRPPIAGFVNFVSGVRYGTSPAEAAVIQNGGGTPSQTSAGIIIRPRSR
jgi:hypothetical protein